MNERMTERAVFALENVSAELTQIRQNLEALVAFQEWQAGQYRQQRDGNLPDGFPGKEQLEAAGIANVEDVPRTSKQLRNVLNGDWNLATEILSTLSTKQKETP